MIGKTLVHYEISAEIGRGGMGEVYQAKDTKLGRDVAIKVLPEEFALDKDRVTRFQREAKLLASLNHPNIAAIYGLEESEGTHFLVMELIEGDTLRDRIKTGPIPVEEALKLGLQMTEALEAAHEKGVIHRDLKPANIKVKPDGKVKVLDFGLAKAYAGDQEKVSLADSPTISAAATQKGVILGTAAYMSPEQAKGKTVDKRADIWAFGVVLFEVLTGKSLFSGEDVSSTLARVLEREPDFSTLPEKLHPRIQLMLERCLKKDPKDRYSGISDARVDIQSVLADPSGVFVQPSLMTKPKKKLRVGISWLAATLVLGLVIAGVAVWILKPLEPRRVVRLDHVLPENQSLNFEFDGMMGHTLAVSPDGARFVYSTSDGLFVRSMNELEARFILGTDENPQSPFFSPDGQWIGYWSRTDNKLKKIPINGGAPVTLCDVIWLFGANWYEDHTIVYSDIVAGIMRVSANGGNPETLIQAISAGPQLLSNGKSIIFTDVSKEPYKVMGQFLDSGERKELFTGAGIRYLPSGQIVYTLENNLYAVPFNPDTLEVTGGPVPILEGVGLPAISDSGTLIYMPIATGEDASGSGVTPQRTLVWIDSKGNETPLPVSSNDYQNLNISPDGTKVAVCMTTEGNADIWIWNLGRETMTRLTFDEAEDSGPIWTPDGQRIVFFSAREGRAMGGIYSKAADGTGEVELLGSAEDRGLIPWSWSGNGNALLMLEFALAPFSTDIGMLSLEGDRKRTPLLQEKNFELDPQVSPDGRWMAYQSDESGRGEIYVRPFPDVNKGRWQVSTHGGNSPLWSPDGRELFYRSNDTTMAVGVETDPTFKPGNPEVLFRGGYYSFILLQIEVTPWDIHPDGKRFLMIKPQGTSNEESPTGDAPSQALRNIHVVLNWFEELKELAPVD